jgi:hypothetical protein
MSRWRAESKDRLTNSTRRSKPSKAEKGLSARKVHKEKSAPLVLKGLLALMVLKVCKVLRAIREIPVTLGRKAYLGLMGLTANQAYPVKMERKGLKVFKASRARKASKGRRESLGSVVVKHSRSGACS